MVKYFILNPIFFQTKYSIDTNIKFNKEPNEDMVLRLKSLKNSKKIKKEKEKPQVVDNKSYFEALCRGEFVI